MFHYFRYTHTYYKQLFNFHPDTTTPCPYHNLSREAALGCRTHLPASSTTGDACSGSRHCGIDGHVWPRGGNGSGTGRRPPLGRPPGTEHLKQMFEIWGCLMFHKRHERFRYVRSKSSRSVLICTRRARLCCSLGRSDALLIRCWWRRLWALWLSSTLPSADITDDWTAQMTSSSLTDQMKGTSRHMKVWFVTCAGGDPQGVERCAPLSVA